MTTGKKEASPKDVKPWERLHGTGRLLAPPEEGVLKDDNFEALRVNDRTSRASAVAQNRMTKSDESVRVNEVGGICINLFLSILVAAGNGSASHDLVKGSSFFQIR